MMKYFLLLLSLICINAHAAQIKPLPSEKAFILSVAIPKQNQITLNWQIAPNYYLYAKKLLIQLPAFANARFNIPQGDFQYDKTSGRYESFAGNISVPIFLKTNEKQIQLNVNYQGCSHDGFCYPPINKSFNIDLQSLTSTAILQDSSAIQSKSLLTDQDHIQSLLSTQHWAPMLFLFLGLGLLLAFTPCVLPMVPILTGIIMGNKIIHTKKAFFLSLSYVLGMAVTYALIGLVAAYMGHSLQVWLQKPVVILFSSLIFVLLALSLFDLYDLKMSQAWQTKIVSLSNRQQAGSSMGVFLMGILSTLIVSPCVTAPLVGILMYIADTGNLMYGAGSLFTLGLGMGLPLLIIGTSVGKWLPKTGTWMQAIKHLFGFMMLGMAIWLAARILPAAITTFLWGSLLIIIAFFLAMFLPKLIGKHFLNRGLGLSVGTCGLLILFGAINPNALLSLHHNTNMAQNSFIIVRNVDDLNHQLQLAQMRHQPVLIDFYADWCESCVMMDKTVFNVQNVQQKLKPYVLLRADLTASTAEQEMLLKTYKIIAPPTVLFFNGKGEELHSKRIVGEVNANEFINRLASVDNSQLATDTTTRGH
jgi:thioredoxin:protein disulfide reductase